MLLIATEDELSESVAVKLVKGAGYVEADFKCVRKGGFGYLKTNVRRFMQIAKYGSVFMLTDLDASECAPSLVASWLGTIVCPTTFLLRVAVREVEAWLMADRSGFAKFMGIVIDRVPRDVERVADPKRHLLKLAQGARRDLRTALLPAARSAAVQGFDYNVVLSTFVMEKWSIARAAENSDSLRRAVERLRLFAR